MTTPESTRPESTLDILFANVLAALDDLAEYEPASLADVHAILERTAARETCTGSIVEKLADILERAGRSRHLTDLPDQGDLVQAVTAYTAGIVLDGDAADAIGEALEAIEMPWEARTADEFHHAHDVLVLNSRPAAPVADAEIEQHLDRGLARLAASLPAAWDDGPAIPKTPGPRPPSDGTRQ